MPVKCDIELLDTGQSFYKAGDTVRGVLRIDIEKRTKFDYISLEFVGKGKTKWREYHGRRTRTYGGREIIFFEERHFLKETSELEGKLKHDFNFTLPLILPSSYQEKHCSIRYYFRAKFEKSGFFSRSKKFERDIYVSGFVTPVAGVEPAVFSFQKSLFKMFSNNESMIDVTVEIPTLTVPRGAHFNLIFTVNNNSDIIIPRIIAELLCKTLLFSSGGRSRNWTLPVENCSVETIPIAERSFIKLFCSVQTLQQTYSIQNAKLIFKEYVLRLTLKLPMPHSDKTVDIPVVIGEKAITYWS